MLLVVLLLEVVMHIRVGSNCTVQAGEERPALVKHMLSDVKVGTRLSITCFGSSILAWNLPLRSWCGLWDRVDRDV